MAITIIEIILAIVISAITGAIASLIAPWANWGVEKKKKKLFWRKGFINECKRMIGENRFDPDVFRETSNYSNLKPYLSVKLQKEINEKRYTPGNVMSLKQRKELAMKEFFIKKKLFYEINFLEKKWGLL